MAMKVKEVDLWDILFVNFAKILFMGTMSCTCICLLNILLAIYVKGGIQDNMSTMRITVTWRSIFVKSIIFVRMRLALPKNLLFFQLNLNLRGIMPWNTEGTCLDLSVMPLFRFVCIFLSFHFLCSLMQSTIDSLWTCLAFNFDARLSFIHLITLKWVYLLFLLLYFQIPTRFQYWRSNEQDRQGRRRGSRLHSSDNQLSLAIQTTFETANVEQYRHAILSAQAVSNDREAHDSESIINSFEPLAIRESETPSRDSHASARNTTARLEESYFPPLPVASSSSRQKYRNDSEELSGNTMAARLRHQNNGTVAVLNSSLAWPAGSHQPSSLSNFPNSSKRKPAKVNEYLPSTRVSPAQSRLATADVVISSNYRSSSRNSGSTSQVGHSALIPNLVDTGSFETSVSSFPPLSASQTNKTPSTSQPKPKLEHVHPANKSLVEKIRAALEFDENKYAAFKKMSAEYRQGLVDTGEYLASIYQFGLSPHVLELARLCPDPQKQKELVETYNFNMRTCGSHDNSLSSDDGWCKNKRSSKKGKKKCGENGLSGSEDALAYRIISSARNLQSNYGPSDGEVEVLSTDGNRIGKGKSKIDVDDEQTNSTPINQLITEPKIQDSSHFAGGGSKKNFRTGGGGNKQGKKISKFLRNRLGNNATSLLDYSDPGPNQTEEKADEDKDPPQGLQVCGAWRNGGGRRIVAITQREHKK
ncbi:uncharacterized protein LOC132172751 isoform X3 [Corylus avellana]|uniref:uncharacterized protein LOC132172751 isoform X3 n=1 Tax=Corylus avellana TaxID=13451 RepID=UPI00286ABBB4|nr:uncharacterized protein LOC132172751 isoform X3 [Corylus avellana]